MGSAVALRYGAGMSLSASIIERAYQLARSGRCRSVADVAHDLKREGFESVDAHLSPGLRSELKTIIKGAQRTL